MPISSVMYRSILSSAVASAAIACGLAREPYSVQPTPHAYLAAERKAVRSADLVLSVDTAPKVAREVELRVNEAGGFIQRSSARSDGGASLQCRLPAAQLGHVMDRIAGLGHEERRFISASDVTEQYADLEARLRTSIALRDRLLHLLGRADGITDVLTVERELDRVQAAIESMQARLEFLKSQVELAELSVILHRKHKLGPLSYVGYGIWRGVSKLFVIR
jgi:predicted nuclease with TOPRIM domain